LNLGWREGAKERWSEGAMERRGDGEKEIYNK
jgi:hypothetical protein